MILSVKNSTQYSTKFQHTICTPAHPHTNKNTLAVLSSIKIQVFCVGDKLKMVKNKA